MIKTILFDLDGTLLPMNNDEFTKHYFKLLCAELAPKGYDPQTLIDAIWTGTAAMVRNDNQKTNEEAFWECFVRCLGSKSADDREAFETFYRTTFNKAKEVCGIDEDAISLVKKLKANGTRIVLATNPIFPETATLNRIRWAGFEPEDFELYTTYENIGYCKPNPAYFKEVADRIGVDPSECLMVGNDAEEDLASTMIGMKFFLITDNLINKKNTDISKLPQGSFRSLGDYLEKIGVL